MPVSIEKLDRILSSSNINEETMIEQAHHLERSGLPYLSIAIYNSLIDKNSEAPEPYLGKSSVYRSLGDLKNSLGILNEAMVKFPDHDATTHLLSLAYLDCRQEHAAVAAMKYYLSRHPKTSHLRIHLVQALYQLRYFDESAKNSWLTEDRPGTWWTSALKRSSDALSQRRCAAIQLLRQRRSERNIPQQDLFRLATFLAEIGRLKAARKITSSMMRSEPSSFGSFRLHHFIIKREQGLEAALSFLESIEWLHSGKSEYHSFYAENLYQLQRYEQLISYCDRHPSADKLDHISEARAFAYYHVRTLKAFSGYIEKWAKRDSRSTKVNSFRVMLSRSVSPQIQSTSETEGIPATCTKVLKSIIQFWDTNSIPEEVQLAVETWKNKNPQYTHQIFSEETAKEFIEKEYGLEMARNFDFCHHPAMKSDLFRVAYLYKKGGIYVDADEVCLRPMDDLLLIDNRVDFIASVAEGTPGYIHNWFLATIPGSRVLELAIEDVDDTLRSNRLSNRRGDLWHVTGPGLITRAVGRFIAEQNGNEVNSDVKLITEKHYRSFSIEQTMSYKGTLSGNWRNAR